VEMLCDRNLADQNKTIEPKMLNIPIHFCRRSTPRTTINVDAAEKKPSPTPRPGCAAKSVGTSPPPHPALIFVVTHGTSTRTAFRKPQMTRDSPKFKVIVVGAGIGGIACAVECKRKGYDVSMYDAARSFARLGDTIGLYFLACRCLSADSRTAHNSYIDGLRSWIVN